MWGKGSGHSSGRLINKLNEDGYHVIYAIDATPRGYGGVKAKCPVPLARALYRQNAGRGENGRLDWGGDKLVRWEFRRMRRPTEESDTLFGPLTGS